MKRTQRPMVQGLAAQYSDGIQTGAVRRVVSVFGPVSTKDFWSLLKSEGLSPAVSLVRRVVNPGRVRLDVYLCAPQLGGICRFLRKICRSHNLHFKFRREDQAWPPASRKSKLSWVKEGGVKSMGKSLAVDYQGNKTRFSIATWNVAGLAIRYPDVKDLLRGPNRPDILCIQETRCSVADADLFAVPGYRLYSSPGLGKRKRWGVGIYVSESLAPFTKLIEKVTGESIFLAIGKHNVSGSVPAGASTLVGTVYLSPNGLVKDRLRRLKQRLRRLSRHHVLGFIGGDFNHESRTLWSFCSKWRSDDIVRRLRTNRTCRRLDRFVDKLKLHFGCYRTSPCSSRRKPLLDPEFAIDHILMSADFADLASMSVRTRGEGNQSDHCPVFCYIEKAPLSLFELCKPKSKFEDPLSLVQRPWEQSTLDIPVFLWKRAEFRKEAGELLSASASRFESIGKEGTWGDWLAEINKVLAPISSSQNPKKRSGTGCKAETTTQQKLYMDRKRAFRELKREQLACRRKAPLLSTVAALSEKAEKYIKARKEYKSHIRQCIRLGSEQRWKDINSAIKENPSKVFDIVQKNGFGTARNGLDQSTVIRTKTGSLVKGIDVLAGWREHFRELSSGEYYGPSNETERSKDQEVATEYLSMSTTETGKLMLEISYAEFVKVVKNLPTEKSAGPDRIPYELYSLLISQGVDGKPSVILQALLSIMNKVVSTLNVPLLWKQSFIVPVFKSGVRVDPKCHRGIALQVTILKVLQRVLADRLVTDLDKRNFILPEQLGFRSNCSCVEQASVLLDVVKRRFQEKLRTNVVYVDLKKAYDSVPHVALVRKLCDAGVSRNYIRLLQNIYGGHLVKVKTLEGVSDPYLYKVGLLQGAGDSCPLFTIFINDLLEPMYRKGLFAKVPSLESGPRGPDGVFRPGFAGALLADDIALVAENDADSQSQCDVVTEWCARWDMNVGIEKCGVMRFGKETNSGPELTLQGLVVPEVEEYVYLGINISRTMYTSDGVREACSHVCHRLKQLMVMVRSVDSLLTRATHISPVVKLRVIDSMLVTSASYGMEVVTSTATVQEPLQKVLDNCVRKCLHLRARSSSRVIMRLEACMRSLYHSTRFRQAKAIIGWFNKEPSRYWSSCLIRNVSTTKKTNGVFGWILRWFRLQHSIELSGVSDMINIRAKLDHHELDRMTRQRDSQYASNDWYRRGAFFRGFSLGAAAKKEAPAFFLKRSLSYRPGLFLFISMRVNAFLTVSRLRNGRIMKIPNETNCLCNEGDIQEDIPHILLECAAYKKVRPYWDTEILKAYKYDWDVQRVFGTLDRRQRACVLLGGKWVVQSDTPDDCNDYLVAIEHPVTGAVIPPIGVSSLVVGRVLNYLDEIDAIRKTLLKTLVSAGN